MSALLSCKFLLVQSNLICYTESVNGVGTHHKKRLYTQFTAKGRIPIEKNIVVVDANGNQYEATYPKRAKGLVKSGRARFIDETTIMLLCPPKNQNELEDNIMSENMKNISNIAEVQNIPETQEMQSQKFTLDYCLEQMEQIRLQTEYLNDVIAELGKITSTGAGDVFSREKVTAFGDVVKCRETTNQRLIAFYEKMYDDLKPVKADITVKKELLAMLIAKLNDPDVLETEDAVQSICHLIDNTMKEL